MSALFIVSVPTFQMIGIGRFREQINILKLILTKSVAVRALRAMFNEW